MTDATTPQADEQGQPSRQGNQQEPDQRTGGERFRALIDIADTSAVLTLRLAEILELLVQESDEEPMRTALATVRMLREQLKSDIEEWYQEEVEPLLPGTDDA